MIKFRTMVNAYDFSDDEQSNDLTDIGKKLSEVNKSKDSLIKLLKVKVNVRGLYFQDMLLNFPGLVLQRAGKALETTSQTDASAKSASKAVAKAVVSKSVLDHKDKASSVTLHIVSRGQIADWVYAAGCQNMCSLLPEPHPEDSCTRFTIQHSTTSGAGNKHILTF